MSTASNDGISDTEKINILFKNLLGFTSTKHQTEFYQETKIPQNNNIFSEEILQDKPTPPTDWTSQQEVTTISELQAILVNGSITCSNIEGNDSHGNNWITNKTAYLSGKIYKNGSAGSTTDSTLLRFVDIELDYLGFLSGCYILKDNLNSGPSTKNFNNLLTNVLSSGYASLGVGLALKISWNGETHEVNFAAKRTDLAAATMFNNNNINFGGPLLDIKNGTLTFYDVNETTTLSTTNIFNPTTDKPRVFLSFTKYVGKKGVSSTSLENPSDGTIALQVNDSGNVGIGTTSPTEKLHVAGDLLLSNSNGGGLIKGLDVNHAIYLRMDRHGTTSNVMDFHEYGKIRFYTNEALANQSLRMTIEQGGTVKIEGQCSASSFNATSDIRFKENIVELENPLQRILSLRAVNYNFKEHPETKHAGVIAQEVDKIIPEAVNKNDDDRWSLNYNSLFSYYIEAIKELNKKIDEKDEEMEKEKAKTAKLETQMKDLLERT